MSQPKIELLKPREFSELINDTFLFVRQNFKPLVKCFFTFCGFFLVATAAAMCMQQLRMVEAINSINTFDSATTRSFSFSSRFAFLGWDYIVAILFTILNYVTMFVTIFSYIALYREKGNQAPTVEEVWGYIKYYFLRILGASIVLMILLILGFVFCVIPGIYLYPIFTLVAPIMIFENTSFGYAFNQSFRLIKEYWWITFGALFVMSLIAGLSAAVVTAPVAIANVIVMLVHGTKDMHMSVPLTLLTVILQQLATVLHILPLVTVALCYFNLTEVKEGTGLMGRIQNFGNPDAPGNDLPAEEY